MNDDIDRIRRYPSDNGSDPQNGIHPAVEVLSEYLDTPNELDPAEREAIEGHLTGCEECRNVLADLRMMVQALKTLPVREAPRSFALTPALLEPVKTPERPAPVVLQESRQWHARHASKVRWATAVAAILFVFVISADLMTNGIGGRTGSPNAAQDEMITMRAASDADAPEAATTFGYVEEESLDAAAGSEVADDAALEEEEAAVQEEAEADSAAGEEPTAAAAEAADEEEAPPSEQPASADAPDSDGAAPTAESETALVAPGEDAGDLADDDMSTMSGELDQFAEDSQPEAASGSNSDQLGWRIAEVSLALVLALLLAVLIGLPKQRGARRR